jgi:excisionase family DNA binding protein
VDPWPGLLFVRAVVLLTQEPAMTRKPTTPTLGQPLLTDHQVAELLGVSRTTVRRLRYDGALPFLYVAGVVRIRPEDVAAYVQAQTVGA